MERMVALAFLPLLLASCDVERTADSKESAAAAIEGGQIRAHIEVLAAELPSDFAGTFRRSA